MKKIICKVLTGSRKFKRLAGVHGQVHGLRSGLVMLKSKESVGLHTTAHKEEAIIILKGKAKVSYGSKSAIVSENTFIYISQNTPHNLENIGRGLLKYVYVTAT